ARFVIESTLEDGGHKRVVRATFDRTPGAAHELQSAIRIDDHGAHPMNADAYEQLMSETFLAADRNEETLGTESVTLSVGKTKLEATKTRYRVVVGKRKATMSTVSSAAFAWGDVGGEILADDGKVLYRVEVLDAGNAR